MQIADRENSRKQIQLSFTPPHRSSEQEKKTSKSKSKSNNHEKKINVFKKKTQNCDNQKIDNENEFVYYALF